MYRAIGFHLNKMGIAPENVEKQDLENIKLDFDENNEILLNNINIEPKIRTPNGGIYASNYATIGVVRDFLGKLQKHIVKKGRIHCRRQRHRKCNHAKRRTQK